MCTVLTYDYPAAIEACSATYPATSHSHIPLSPALDNRAVAALGCCAPGCSSEICIRELHALRD